MLDRADPRPLGVQLADQVRRLVLAGTLAPGSRLPSTRRLATDLGVSRARAAAEAAGFRVNLLADYCRSAHLSGLVVGFGGPTDEELERALAVLAESLAE